MTPNELGPSTRMPLPRASATSRRCRSRTVGAGLGEAGRHHDEAAHAFGRAVGDDLLDLLGGYRDDGEVDRAGHVA